MAVMRSARRFNSASGTAVSAASIHLRLTNGIQSIAYWPVLFDNTRSLVCRPSSSAWRYRFMYSFASSARITLCARSFSAYNARARMLRDLFVHQGLSDRGRILFIMAEPAETDDIHHHILVESGAKIHRQLHGEHHRFRIIAIDVQHRRFDHFDDIRA